MSLPDSNSLDVNDMDMDDPIPSNPNHLLSQKVTLEVDDIPTTCTLHLTSHGHRFGPFTPPKIAGLDRHTILQYDIRVLPNPPKTVRTQQTGLHKPLREWFFARPEAVAKMEEVCAALDAALADLDLSTNPPGREVAVHVVVFCEMGKHRSVAFVEELARRPFFVDTASGRQKCGMSRARNTILAVGDSGWIILSLNFRVTKVLQLYSAAISRTSKQVRPSGKYSPTATLELSTCFSGPRAHSP
ncbi:hypothetical protein B0H16DRAFT_1697538 [Mycena metata]|uniref:RapZ C-terminal domain-containing protein n=1 Tax=Mycena metata TaxID=1033252 RepID=A0AAD7MQE2_9AGAR|nr:hypothetical protein B0H16DRAFT_1697538 [Mycena metata]